MIIKIIVVEHLASIKIHLSNSTKICIRIRVEFIMKLIALEGKGGREDKTLLNKLALVFLMQ